MRGLLGGFEQECSIGLWHGRPHYADRLRAVGDANDGAEAKRRRLGGGGRLPAGTVGRRAWHRAEARPRLGGARRGHGGTTGAAAARDASEPTSVTTQRRACVAFRTVPIDATRLPDPS